MGGGGGGCGSAIVYSESNSSSECPVCRDTIDQPCTNLMDNMFASLEPEKPATPEEDVPHMCTACDEGQEAPFYCMQCEEWLCDSCVDAHKRVRITKDHTIVPKAEVRLNKCGKEFHLVWQPRML